MEKIMLLVVASLLVLVELWGKAKLMNQAVFQHVDDLTHLQGGMCDCCK